MAARTILTRLSPFSRAPRLLPLYQLQADSSLRVPLVFFPRSMSRVENRYLSKSVNSFLSSFANLVTGCPQRFHSLVPPGTAASCEFRLASDRNYKRNCVNGHEKRTFKARL